MNKAEHLLNVMEDALDEYAELGGSFDEDDLRDILDTLVRDFREFRETVADLI
jgi:hypothetical protein